MLRVRVIGFIVVGSLITGCAALGNMLAEGALPIARSQAASFEEEGDYDKAAGRVKGDIGLLEGLVGMAPDHGGLGAVAAQAYGGYAFGFLEPIVGPLDQPDPAAVTKAKAFYLKGREAGLRSLRQNQAFLSAERQEIELFSKAVGSFGVVDVPALFWTAYNWGQLVNLSKDEPELVVELPRVTALMERVKELDPNYYHGGVHGFEMVNAAARPPLLGGQPDVAKAAFERAAAVDAGRFLTHDVMFAQYYAVQIQDPKLFRETLSRVLQARVDILPAARLPNVIAKRRAEILLSRISDFFPDLEDEAQGAMPATEVPRN